ncbi:MAG: AAC(3) family N-acetyltransferase [Eubacteriales bacterium]
MFIFGWGYRTFKKFGVVKQICSHCQKEGEEMELIKVTLWITLFFIPVIPTSKRYLLMCHSCKGIIEIDKETFLRYINNDVTKEREANDFANQQYYGNKTETQINYLRQIEEYKKEQAEKINNETKKRPTTIEGIIKQTDFPITTDYLSKELEQLGLKKGMNVLVHSSLSSLGWVCGGSIAVIQALQNVITDEGTIIMPTHSGDYSDPAHWRKPPVPKEWHEKIRESLPAYDAEKTPTRGVGVIPEVFRTLPDVIRSKHPHFSLAAYGKNSETIIREHPLNYGLSKDSPLGKIYGLDNSYILLLGADYDSNSIFHIAEYIHPKAKEIKLGAPIIEEGKRVWKTFNDIELNNKDFKKIGTAFEKTNRVKTARVGSAECKFFPVKEAVDFAMDWIIENRQ